jgi:hypothetical protein
MVLEVLDADPVPEFFLTGIRYKHPEFAALFSTFV